MNVLSQLSSKAGDRTQGANRQVAALCLVNSALLGEIAGGLGSSDSALAGDCAEVLTMVAEQQTALVAPYADQLSNLLDHPKTRIRWEAMHALSLVAALRPDVIGPLLPRLDQIMHEDGSIIVRDYTIDAAGNYALASVEAAQAAYPVLLGALTVWDSRHANHALQGLIHVVQMLPHLHGDIRTTAEPFLAHNKDAVRKAARKLMKVVR